MSEPLQVRIETLTIHASSALEARSLADALPAALERALAASALARNPVASNRGVIDAGAVTRTTGLADTVARQIAEAALPKQTQQGTPR
jgi:hypothetical protein